MSAKTNKTINLTEQDEEAIIKINGFPIARIVNRVDEDILEIDVIDTNGVSVLNQSISPTMLGLFEEDEDVNS